MVLPNRNQSLIHPPVLKASAFLMIIVLTVLSFIPGGSLPSKSSNLASLNAASTLHWRAHRRIYPNQQASGKSAIEAPRNIYTPPVSKAKIVRFFPKLVDLVSASSRFYTAVHSPILRI